MRAPVFSAPLPMRSAQSFCTLMLGVNCSASLVGGSIFSFLVSLNQPLIVAQPDTAATSAATLNARRAGVANLARRVESVVSSLDLLMSLSSPRHSHLQRPLPQPEDH